MADTAIRVENLGKQYRIGGPKVRYKTIRETLNQAVQAPFRRLSAVVRGQSPIVSQETIWALKDVSFEVKRGEVVGVIGRNGAGKTTLLKVLSRITEPTHGRVRIRGRVGSLLEVGTGFHPELTGRENIYLNGAILGMKRQEIERKFDEIVSFAEIEKFIDTPVKHYSSGMYVRLAFAVAAHLEPEILLLDEVLAVGDATFQKKCVGKLQAVATEGRAVLFVSHNMGVIREMAPRGVWLHEGKILFDGGTREAISRYLSSSQSDNQTRIDLSDHPNRLPGMKLILGQIICRSADGAPSTDFSQFEDIVLQVDYGAPDGLSLSGAGFIVDTADGVRVGGFNTYMAYQPPQKLPKRGKVIFEIPAGQFTPGRYLISVSLGSHYGVLEDKVESAIGFTVHPADIYGTGYLLTEEDGVAALNAGAHIHSLE